MHPNLLETFKAVTGSSERDIIGKCATLPLDDKTILEFYMYYKHFPSERECLFISDIGLPNYNIIRINSIRLL